MGEKEDKEKAEKLAAAKKRVAQLQKKKKAGEKAGGKAKDKAAKDDAAESASKEKDAADAEQEAHEQDEALDTDSKPTTEQPAQADDEPVDEDEQAFNDAIKSAGNTGDTTALKSTETEQSAEDSVDPPKPSKHPARQASISIQSKLRSTSFRDTAPGLMSPNGGGSQRIEELERENKRLAEEAAEHESRWRQVEEQLDELREEQATGESKQIESLKSEIEVLKRQQRNNSGSGGGKISSRRESAANMLDESSAPLLKDLEAKDSTIADMQLEISRLRSQLSSQTEGCETHGSQISALQTSLDTAETKLRSAESDLADSKKSLNRASEKAVQDGTERTSRDTKIRTLERDFASTTTKLEEAMQKATQLEKKIEAMNKLHREAEARTASKLSAAEAASRDIPTLRTKVATLEAENARLREKHKRHMSGGGGDEGLDELEDEERNKLERRIRELEGQVFDLQRGVWRDKRTAMQPDIAQPSRPSLETAARNPEEGFDEIDLSGAGSRRTSSYVGGGGGGGGRNATTSPVAKHSNFTQYLSSGFNAFMAPQAEAGLGGGGGRPRNDSLLQDFDDDGDGFDEAAFARAQRDEEMKKMVEHVREVKRGLTKWKGWRLDLVETRRGEVGMGDVFEV